jgi:hypothetical protein
MFKVFLMLERQEKHLMTTVEGQLQWRCQTNRATLNIEGAEKKINVPV